MDQGIGDRFLFVFLYPVQHIQKKCSDSMLLLTDYTVKNDRGTQDQPWSHLLLFNGSNVLPISLHQLACVGSILSNAN